MRLFANPSARQLNAGLAVLRAAIGTIFVAHGAQKLFDNGLDAVTAGFGSMGIPLAGIVAPGVALLEFLGGIALILGLLTRPVGLLLALNMLGALLLVHLPKGFFLPGGIEFVLALGSASLLLAFTGAGAWSIDGMLARRRSGSAAAPDATTARPTRRAA